MKFDDIQNRIAPLISDAAPDSANWLRSLFSAQTSQETFTALESELFIGDQELISPVLVTSATRGEGRTTISLLLSVMTSASDLSRRVLLIDGDVDNGRIASMLGISDIKAGLGEYFDGAASVDDCIHATAISNLSVVPVTGGTNTPVRLVPKLFESFITGLGGRFDLVVVDSPAGGRNKGVLSMTHVVKNTLLVLKYAGPTHEQVAVLLDDLSRAGARVIGCVMNKREFEVPLMLYGHG